VIRSLVALIGGFAIMTFALLFATVIAAYATGATAETIPMNFRIMTTAATPFAAAVAGFACATLARARHWEHVVFLAGLVAVMAVSTAITARSGEPAWYLYAPVVLGPLGVLLGGSMRLRSKARVA